MCFSLLHVVKLSADDATTPAYGHPELRSADRAFLGPEEGSYNYSADDSGRQRTTADDATTPAYGHPSSPEEGSYNYSADDSG